MTDVELVKRADASGPCWQEVWASASPDSQANRGAALWQALNALRGLELVR